MDTRTNMMTLIVEFMGAAQTVKMEGFDKKAYVMNKLKSHFGQNIFDRYEPLISVTIDFIKTVAKNKSLLKGIASTNWGLCCLK